MAADALELAHLLIDRWNAADLDAVYERFAPDIVVRPDRNFPDATEIHGVRGAKAFWESNREAMGPGELQIQEEIAAGHQCLMRIRQHVHARASGIQGTFDWSFLATVAEGKVVRAEFFIDHAEALAALEAAKGAT
jgi:ketosteroid isomerase-like protein